MDREFLKVVYEDLCYIQNSWNMQNVADEKLRRDSDVLRRLFIYNDIYKAAGMVGWDRRIRVQVIQRDYAGSAFYQAGGGTHQHLQVSDLAIYDRALSTSEIKQLYQANKKAERKRLKLDQFLKSPSMVIGGVHVSHADIIKYVCNKLGSAHYNSKRKEEEYIYKLLDEHREGIEVAGKNTIFFALLSIGQKFLNNKDIQGLIKRIKESLQEQ